VTTVDTLRRGFGTGPLSRAAALVYTLLAVELLLLATAAPGLVVLVLLDRDLSNLPLVAACAVPAGPAVSAALYALHHRGLDLTDLHPARAFWRGYRLNVRGALAIWVAWLAWVTVIAVNLANRSVAGVPGWWTAMLLLIALAATLWMLNALVITSLFVFRLRDVARLAVYLLVRKPGVVLGTAGLVLAAFLAMLQTSEAVLALLGSLFVLALLAVSRELIRVVREEFTA
jgi:hypothetical protein